MELSEVEKEKQAASTISSVKIKARMTVEKLNRQFKNLSAAERALMRELQNLRKDEAKLWLALEELKETRHEKMARGSSRLEESRRNEEALQNLHKALMADSDSNSSSEDDGDHQSMFENVDESDFLQIHEL